ncbi:hypothetical protein WJX84_000033 [Apatococcus fuscideae]|uniref:Expansin-like EG45 domain-containing protein n=1 Tax=Apatococcus fuscideae TaxID=2026836 RepID=A0AAW1SRP6_9CHLO
MAFSRTTEAIHTLIDKYKTDHGLESLKVSYSGRRGFSLSIAIAGAKRKDGKETSSPPASFMPLPSTSKTRTCWTTHELNALNGRLRSASHDCLSLTEMLLDKILLRVSAEMSYMHKLVDGLALLDMMCSFANMVHSSSEEYTRPVLTTSGPFAMIDGRHPVLEQLEQAPDFQQNDLYLTECSSFHLITGPNMSGKSTYLRQVAVLIIMAQIGCYVPAKLVSIQPFEKLLVCMGTMDSIESNRSSFMTEMRDVAHITSTANNRSIVLIDELGAATSTTDGTAIAWAVSEHLIAEGVFTLFATHFSALKQLENLYPSVKVCQFAVDTGAGSFQCTWQLKAGAVDVPHYGLLLATNAGFPEQVIEVAQRVAKELQEQEMQSATPACTSSHAAQQACHSLAHRVLCIAQNGVQHGYAVVPEERQEAVEEIRQYNLQLSTDKERLPAYNSQKLSQPHAFLLRTAKEATNYGGPADGNDPYSPSFGTSIGSCGYGKLSKTAWPYWSVAALSTSNVYYKAGPVAGCGQCFEIQCMNSGGQYAGRCAGNTGKESIIVMISDECPECEADHIDIQAVTFGKIAPIGNGRIDIQYRRVECTPPSNMMISVDGNSGAGGWIRLSIKSAADRAAIKSVQLKGPSSSWVDLNNIWGAEWETGSQPSSYPLDISITQDDNQQVTCFQCITKTGFTGQQPTNIQFKTNGGPSNAGSSGTLGITASLTPVLLLSLLSAESMGQVLRIIHERILQILLRQMQLLTGLGIHTWTMVLRNPPAPD